MEKKERLCKFKCMGCGFFTFRFTVNKKHDLFHCKMCHVPTVHRFISEVENEDYKTKAAGRF